MLPLPVPTQDPNTRRLAARQRETFSGVAAGVTVLTLADAPVDGHEAVYRNGALLLPGAAYTLSGRQILLAAAVAAGDAFQVIYYYRQGA